MYLRMQYTSSWALFYFFFFFNTSLFVWSILALDREEGKVGICLIEFGSVSSSLLDI